MGGYVGLKVVPNIDTKGGSVRVIELARVWHFVVITEVCRYYHSGAENVSNLKRARKRIPVTCQILGQ